MPELFLPKPPKAATAVRLRVDETRKAILRIKDIDCIKGCSGILDFGTMNSRGSFEPMEGTEQEWDGWGLDPNEGTGNERHGAEKIPLSKSKA